MLLNIYSTSAIYGLAILPMVVLPIPAIQKYLFKIASDFKSLAYSIPIYVWLIFMSDLGQSIFEQVILWGSVVAFLFLYAMSLATFTNKPPGNE